MSAQENHQRGNEGKGKKGIALFQAIPYEYYNRKRQAKKRHEKPDHFWHLMAPGAHL